MSRHQDCSKLECCAIKMAAHTMKMQEEVTERLEEAKAYQCKANEFSEKANALEEKANRLVREAREISNRLEDELKKSNILMIKAIKCYKERDDRFDPGCECCDSDFEEGCNCRRDNSCLDDMDYPYM